MLTILDIYAIFSTVTIVGLLYTLLKTKLRADSLETKKREAITNYAIIANACADIYRNVTNEDLKVASLNMYSNAMCMLMEVQDDIDLPINEVFKNVALITEEEYSPIKDKFYGNIRSYSGILLGDGTITS